MNGLTDLSFLSSILVMMMTIASMRFFWPLLRKLPTSFEKCMVASVMWMGGTMFARTFYWDVLQGVLNRPAWVVLRDTLRGQEFSTLFNVGFIVALYYALQGARFLLPEDERDDWPFWKVWTYPAGPCVVRWKNNRKDKQ